MTATREYISKNPSDTIDIGEQIGREAKPGALYALTGELGAGKTQLTKGIARGIGVLEWKYVVSPTFTIMNCYEGEFFHLCHVDLYRLEDGEEVEDLFLEEYLTEGIVVVEWSEKVAWGEGVIRVFIEWTGEEERKITVVQ